MSALRGGGHAWLYLNENKFFGVAWPYTTENCGVRGNSYLAWLFVSVGKLMNRKILREFRGGRGSVVGSPAHAGAIAAFSASSRFLLERRDNDGQNKTPRPPSRQFRHLDHTIYSSAREAC
jgi:hypothetical protein